jgi:hypothetical protein
MFHLLLISSFVLTASLYANYGDDEEVQGDFLAGDVSPEEEEAPSMYSSWEDAISDEDNPESYGEVDEDILIDDEENTGEDEEMTDDDDEEEDVNN